ncbi:hypothetical protein An02g03430 [Aspergillus niger]|uniref:Uncharacterized protein n=2 Tax=Aspergillus niger TaxID=5061 RepID=A2QCF9_ASPNC|nr:hypothetical protein An02g03430 [Aspergillus niger]CAK47623.1 hypothetical protein An02g03430 [Aspergillus niger]
MKILEEGVIGFVSREESASSMKDIRYEVVVRSYGHKMKIPVFKYISVVLVLFLGVKWTPDEDSSDQVWE